MSTKSKKAPSEFRIIFNPDGIAYIPDVPAELFGVIQALGSPVVHAAAGDRAWKQPKYLRAKRTRVEISPQEIESLPVEILWRTLSEPSRTANYAEGCSLLDVAVELARRSMAHCDLCEWQCHVNRLEDQPGYCQSGRTTNYSRCFLDFGEEKSIIPSIVISLNGCNWSCPYCQYPEYLDTSAGNPLYPGELAQSIEELWRSGGKTIHWLGGNPDQHLWAILQTLQRCQAAIPVVWNSNGYTSAPAMRLLESFVDIYIIDLKYGNNACGSGFGAGPLAWDILTRNLKLAAAQDAELIVRHLQLPGHFDCCTKPILTWLANDLPGIKVNLLGGHYYPAHLAYRIPSLNRRLTRPEKDATLELAHTLGIQLIS
jgi:putative pyruvate formate lyase activating enzyme